jgi:hypothetical protein
MQFDILFLICQISNKDTKGFSISNQFAKNINLFISIL